MIPGYTSKPVAVRRENGTYLVLDGHHRADIAYSAGKPNMDMYVIDAKDYAPHIAGRPAKKTDASENAAILRELGLLD